MNAPKSLASEPDDGRPKREGDSCEGRKPAVEPPALPPPANNVLAAPWPPLAFELRPAIPAAPIREGEEPTVGPVIEPTGGAGGEIEGEEREGEVSAGGGAEGGVIPPVGLVTLGRVGGGGGDDEVDTRGSEGGGGGGDAVVIRGSEGGGGGGEGGGLMRGSEGGGGSGDAGGGGGGGGGRIRGVVTVVVGSDGVATVVLGVTGVDGARTVVVGSDGVLTVVVGSWASAPPANARAAVKPAAVSATTPSAPAARRPPSQTDRTALLFPPAAAG
jgi:hypothetical protein